MTSPAPGARRTRSPARCPTCRRRRCRRICCGATSRSTRWRSRSSAIWPGTLEAAPLGLEDLKRRSLRVLHDASFIDDPTRALRLARYALEARVRDRAAYACAAGVGAGRRSDCDGQRLTNRCRAAAAGEGARPGERASAALGELGIAHAIHPALGLDDEPLARRALALLPDDGRPRPAGACARGPARAATGACVPAPHARVRGLRPPDDHRRGDEVPDAGARARSVPGNPLRSPARSRMPGPSSLRWPARWDRSGRRGSGCASCGTSGSRSTATT